MGPCGAYPNILLMPTCTHPFVAHRQNIPTGSTRVLGFHLIPKSKPLISSNSNVDGGTVTFIGWWSPSEPTPTLKPHSTIYKCQPYIILKVSH